MFFPKQVLHKYFNAGGVGKAGVDMGRGSRVCVIVVQKKMVLVGGQ